MPKDLPPLQFDGEEVFRITDTEESIPEKPEEKSRVKSDLPPLQFEGEPAAPVAKQPLVPLFENEPYVKELSEEEKKKLLDEDTRGFSRGLAYGYEKSDTLESNWGNYLESKFPMGRFILTPKRVVAPLWGGEGPYVSPEEAYGEDFMQLDEQQRRERIDQVKQNYLQQKYPEFYGREDRTWGEAIGEFGGSLASPTTLTPMGRTYKQTAAIGGGLGFAYGAGEGLGQKGEVDPATTATYTGAGVILGPGLKWAGSKIVDKFKGDPTKISSKDAETFVQSYQNLIYERRAIGDSPREAFDYANSVFRVTDDTVKSFTAAAERKIFVPKQQEAQLYIDLVNFNQTGKAPGKISSTFDEFLGVMSTRVKNISVPMWHRLRKLDYNQHARLHNLSVEVNPFLRSLQKLPKDMQAEVDRALLNGKFDVVEAAIKSTGNKQMINDFNVVKSVLNDLYKESVDAGIDVGYRANYFPRFIKDLDGLRNTLGTKENAAIEKLFEEAAKKKGSALNTMEKANIVNKYVRGYPAVVDGGVPFAKARTIEEIPPELMKFYATPEESLHHYLRRSVNEIEKRHFFGRNWNKNALGTTNVDDSIGAIVAREVEAGNVDPKRADELRDLLMTRFGPGEMGTGEGTALVKNTLYSMTLGNPLSAATQLGDTFLATYKNGIRPVIDSFLKKEKITLDDYGFNEIAEEFADASRSAKWLQRNFKWTGFTRVDRLGKETLLNSSYDKYRNMALDPKQVGKFRDKWKKAYGEDVDNLIADLQTGKMSDDVKLLLWHDLADMQPVALSEMPQKYLETNKGRLFYMLKTFTLKQFDILRRDVIQQIKTPGERKEGVKNLAKYMTAFQAAGLTSDAIKAWMQGREFDPSDSAIENFWRMVGASRYSASKIGEEPFMGAVQIIAPPVGVWDSMISDVVGLVQGEDVAGKSVRAIPGIGRLTYEHLMGGKQEYKEKKREEKLKEMGFSLGGMLDQARHLFRKRYAEGDLVIADDEAERDPESFGTDTPIEEPQNNQPTAFTQMAREQLFAPKAKPESEMRAVPFERAAEYTSAAKEWMGRRGSDVPGYHAMADWLVGGTTELADKITTGQERGYLDYLAASSDLPVTGAIGKVGSKLAPNVIERLAMEAPNKLEGFYGNPFQKVVAVGLGGLKMAGNYLKTSFSPSAMADVENFAFGSGVRNIIQDNVNIINKNSKLIETLKKGTPEYTEARQAISEAEKTIVGQLGYNANIARQMGIDSPILREWSEKFNRDLANLDRASFKRVINENSIFGQKDFTQKDLDFLYDYVTRAWGIPEGTSGKIVMRNMKTMGGGDFRQDIYRAPQTTALRDIANKTDSIDDFEQAIVDYNTKIAEQLVGKGRLDPEAAKLAASKINIIKKEGNDIYISFSRKSSSYTEGGVNIVMKINTKNKKTFGFVSDEHDLFGMVPEGADRLITMTPIQRMDEMLDPQSVTLYTKSEAKRARQVEAKEAQRAQELKTKQYEMPPTKKTQYTPLEYIGNLKREQVDMINRLLATQAAGGDIDPLAKAIIGSGVVAGGAEAYRQGYADGGEVVAPVVEEDQPIVESISRRLKTDPDTLRSNLGEVKQAIKQHETGNQNIYQIVDGAARGPGAGYYQFEQKQFGGSGAAKTAVNRTLNTYKFLKQPAPQWLQNLAKDPDPDFTQLDERQQDLIFLGNLNQERGSDKLMRALVEAKNEQEKRAAIENLWRKAHKKVKAFDKFRW